MAPDKIIPPIPYTYYRVCGIRSGFCYFVTRKGGQALPWLSFGIEFTGEPCAITLRTDDNYRAKYQEAGLPYPADWEQGQEGAQQGQEQGQCPFEYVAPLDKGDK